MSDEEVPESDGWDEGWVAAEEHGQDREAWILDQDNYSHPDFPGRDEDGRFNRKFGSRPG
jgi:hypothetical protein